MNISIHTFYQRLMLCILLVLLNLIQLQAQAPFFHWEKKIGGNDQFEGFPSVQQTSDGGYITVGYTASSNTGDIGTTKGQEDCLIVKLSATGEKQWQKTIGGTGNDYGLFIQQTSDGGYIVAGVTESSNSGDIIVTNHGNRDAWIIKLSATGAIQWQKVLGGDKYDSAMSIRQTPDGGYLMVGETESSNSGDVGLNQGPLWVVKLSATGVIQWQKTIGNTSPLQPKRMQLTNDGGCIVVGMIYSGFTLSSAFILKLDNSGTVQWQKTVSSTNDEVGMAVQQTVDSGYIVVGRTYTGAFDSWIKKLSATGTVQWEKRLSELGISERIAVDIQQVADGGYVLVHNFQSGGLNYDMGTLLKISSIGEKQWEKRIINSTTNGSGGSALSFQLTTDGGYIVVGSSFNQITFGNSQDAWIAKLGPLETSTFNLDPTKCYQIVSKVSNLPLGVKDSSTANGAQIYQSLYSDAASQRWTFIKVADNTYNIKSSGSGKMMDIVDNSPAGYCVEGTIIQQFTADGTGSQKWRIEKQADESFKIFNGTCNKPLRVESGSTVPGASVGIKADFGTESFKWFIQEVPCAVLVDPSKCYRIVNKATNKVLEIKDSLRADGTQIYQWASATNRPQQLWQTVRLSDGKYNIISASTGKFMDITDNSPAGYCVEGTIIQQFTGDNTNSQKWRLEPQTDGFYKIANEVCNKYLRVENSSTVNGASVGIKNDFGSDAFKWFFQEAECINYVKCCIDSNKCYRIVNKATNKSLEVKDASTAEGTQIYQWTTTAGRKQQVWQIKSIDPYNAFNIVSKSSGKYMGVDFCSEGTNIKQVSLDGTGNQIWGFYGGTEGFFKIRFCDKGLRVESSSTADGANVGIKNDFGTDAFKWFVQEAGCTNGEILSATNATFGFEARASEGRAKLQWITNTDYKNDYFEIERLNANGNFDILGRQNTYAGDDMKSYTFTDNDPLDGDNFYRINSISNSNTPPQYSEVKKVTFSKNDGISIFPNPADEFINVDLRKYEGKTVSLSIYNSVGLLVKKQTIENVSVTPQQIDVQGFGTGSYLLRVQSEGKREVTRLFHIAK